MGTNKKYLISQTSLSIVLCSALKCISLCKSAFGDLLSPKKKKWETSCLPLLSGPFLPFVSIIPVLPNFDASSRSPFSVWSHILQEHIVWLSSTVYGGWISPTTSSLATYPLPSPSIGLGKILPSSAIDFKLAHHGFQGITLGFWGIFLF